MKPNSKSMLRQQPPNQSRCVSNPKIRQSHVQSAERHISPPIIIQHGTGDDRFYQCSYCGFISSRIRTQWHKKDKCNVGTIKYYHDIHIPNPHYSVFYSELVEALRYQESQLQRWERVKLLQQYQNFISEYQASRENPQTKEIQKQAKKASQENKLIISHLSNQKQTLSSLLQQCSAMKVQFKQQGGQLPGVAIQRQKNIEEVYQTILPTIACHIKSVLYKNMIDNKQFNPEIKEYLVKEIQQSIYKIDVTDSLSTWKIDVQKALDEKLVRINNMEECQLKRKQTQRQTNAASFLSNLSYRYIRNNRLFIQILRNQSIIQQKTSIGLLNLMRDRGSKVPKVSPKVIKRPQKKVKRHITMHIMKSKIKYLMNYNIVLACDLYFAFCLSVRMNDLTRMYVQSKDNQNQFYDYVSITQLKNRHEAIRVVPTDLKKLIVLSNNTYPISKQRLASLREYCFQQFQGFYLLRSSCITMVLSELMKASNFSPHHISSTTLRYYVNYQDYDLMNNIFSLGINISGNDQCIKRSFKRLYLGKIGENPKQYFCNTEQSFETELQFPSSLQHRQEKQLDSLVQQCQYNEKVFKYKTSEIQFLSSKYQLIERFFDNQTCQYFNSLLITKQSCLKLLSCHLGVPIIALYNQKQVIFRPSKHYLSLAQNQTQFTYAMIQQDKCEIKNIQVETTSNDKMMVVSNPIQQSFERMEQQYKSLFKDKEEKQSEPQPQPLIFNSSSEVITSKQKTDSKVVLVVSGEDNYQQFGLVKIAEQLKENSRRSQRIKTFVKSDKWILQASQTCQLKCRNILDTVPCVNCSNFRTVCKCQPNSVECNCKKTTSVYNKQFNACSYAILSRFGIIDQKYNRIVLAKKKNNLVSEIQNTKRKYLTCMAASSSLQKMFLPWESVTNQISDNVKYVLKNQSYLPLKVITISQQKGKGIIATQNIQSQTVIGTYLGVIRSSKQASTQDDSLVSIGWWRRQQYYICCQQASNFGRFFNGSKDQKQANCRLRIAFVKDKGFCPYFISKRKIQKNQEITWYYGNYYPSFE